MSPIHPTPQGGAASPAPARPLRAIAAVAISALALGALTTIAAPALASDGTFNRVIGFGVNPAGANSGVCTLAAACSAGDNGARGGEFNFPEGVATDRTGNIYLADTNNNRVEKLDPSGRFMFAFGKDVNVVAGAESFDLCTEAGDCTAGTPGALPGQFNEPTAVATDAAGDVYVVDRQNQRIQKFNSSGILLSVIGGGGGHGGELAFPEAVATDAVGNLYVAESGNNRISKFDSSGNFVLAFGKDVVAGAGTGFEVCTVAADCKPGVQGTLGGELTEPSAVAVDGQGNIYVADSDSHRVEKFDAAGNFAFAAGKDVDATLPGTAFEVCRVAASCKAGVPGNLPGEFDFPKGIATDPLGNVYVSDLENSRIEKFDSAGAFLQAIGSGGTLGGQLRGPWGIFVDAAGALFVADRENNRVEEFADAAPVVVVGGGATGSAETMTSPGTGAGGSTMASSATAGQSSSFAPRVLNLSQSHPRWRSDRKRTLAARRQSAPVGTTFSVALDQPARITFTFAQKLRGRSIASRCLVPARGNRHRPACERRVSVASLSFAGRTGNNRLAFVGRVSRSSKLAPGRYTTLVTATNSAGQRSASRALSFTIVT